MAKPTTLAQCMGNLTHQGTPIQSAVRASSRQGWKRLCNSLFTRSPRSCPDFLTDLA